MLGLLDDEFQYWSPYQRLPADLRMCSAGCLEPVDELHLWPTILTNGLEIVELLWFAVTYQAFMANWEHVSLATNAELTKGKIEQPHGIGNHYYL